MPFKKGIVTNPNGRPKDLLGPIAKVHTREAFLTILTLMRESDDENIRLKAAITIIERAYGKPVQQINSADELGRIREIIFVRPGADNQSTSGREVHIDIEARPSIPAPDGQS